MTQGKKPYLLIVDNDTDVLGAMGALFKQAGARVRTMSNPLVAVDTVIAEKDSEESFDMVVVDILMPALDGFGVAKQVREAGFEGPIVAFTFTASGFGRKQCEEAGISRYLSKDLLKADLLSAILDEYFPGRSS